MEQTAWCTKPPMRILLVVMVALAGCGAVEGKCCVEATDAGTNDAGVSTSHDAGAVELPVTALIQPLTVVEGLTACPSITVSYADGRTASLILDASYTVPVARSVRIDRAGFQISWESPGGHVQTSTNTNCAGAVLGLTPGTESIRLKVTDPAGRSSLIGTALVTVVGLPAGPVASGSLALRGPSTFPSVSEAQLSVGERRQLATSFELQWPPGLPATAGTTPALEFVDLSSSDAATVAIGPGHVISALRPGSATLRAAYRVGSRVVAEAQRIVEVVAPGAPSSIVFGLPLNDDGVLLPDDSRFLQRLDVGACFTTSLWALELVGSKASLRRIDAEASVTVTGTGLEQRGAPLRFCATAPGDGAIVACAGGRCDAFGFVVATRTPTVQLTLPTELRVGAFGVQTICLDLGVTADFGQGPTDVSSSPALRFAEPFVRPSGNPLRVVIDGATGTPLRRAGKTCFTAEVGPEPAGLRVFYGGGQSEAAITLRF